MHKWLNKYFQKLVWNNYYQNIHKLWHILRKMIFKDIQNIYLCMYCYLPYNNHILMTCMMLHIIWEMIKYCMDRMMDKNLNLYKHFCSNHHYNNSNNKLSYIMVGCLYQHNMNNFLYKYFHLRYSIYYHWKLYMHKMYYILYHLMVMHIN